MTAMISTPVTSTAATLHPVWKEAAARFDRESFAPGDVLSYDWLYESFGLRRPTETTPSGEAKKIELAFLSAFKNFEEELLYGRLVALRNVRSEGYQIVRAEEQTRWAFREGMRDVFRDLKKMTNRLSHVDDTKLTAAQKKENADALSRTATLSTMLSTTRRLPRP